LFRSISDSWIAVSNGFPVATPDPNSIQKLAPMSQQRFGTSTIDSIVSYEAVKKLVPATANLTSSEMPELRRQAVDMPIPPDIVL
jgi:hypothetical protein